LRGDRPASRQVGFTSDFPAPHKVTAEVTR
jgi:hypothetical protein